MDKIKQFTHQLTLQLDKFDFIKENCKKIGVESGVIGTALLSLLVFFVIIDFGAKIITDVVSLVYPAYASFKAIETPEPEDDKQWLTYWVVIGCYSIADNLLDIFFFWVPFYFVIKLVFVLYLALPHTKGAIYLYDHVVKPFLLKNEALIDRKLQEVNDVGRELKDEA